MAGKKGQKAWNKGLKMSEEYRRKCSERQKGKIPANKGKKASEELRKKMSLAHRGKISRQKTLYSERIGKDGYIAIKVYHKDYTTAYSKNIAKCGTKWIAKHHKIWIDNYGDNIPKGSKIVFLDKNKYNFDINNLQLISNQEQVIMNRWLKYSNNPEITKVKLTLSKLKNVIRKKK